MPIKNRNGPGVYFIVSRFYPPSSSQTVHTTYQKAKKHAKELEKAYGFGFHISRIEPCR